MKLFRTGRTKDIRYYISSNFHLLHPEDYKEKITLDLFEGFNSEHNHRLMTIRMKINCLMNSNQDEVFAYLGEKQILFEVENVKDDIITLNDIVANVILNVGIYIQDNSSVYLSKNIDTYEWSKKIILGWESEGWY